MVKRAFILAGSQKWFVLIILGLTLVVAGLSALEPLVMKYIFDGLTENQAAMRLIGLVGALVVLGLIKEAGTCLSNWLTWRTRLKTHYLLLDLTVERIHRMPQEVHRSEGVGAIMTRLDRSIQGLLTALSELSFNVLPAVVYLVTAVVIMYQLDGRLTLLVLAFTPLPVVIASFAAPKQNQRERTLLEKWTKIYSRFNEVLSGIITVRSFAMEDREKRRFLKDVGQANQVVLRGIGFDSSVGAAQNLIILLSRILSIAFGGYLVYQGQVTIGTLIAFLGYLGGLFGPVQGLTGIYKTIRTAAVSLEQVFAILDSEDMIKDAPDAVCPTPIHGRIAFEKVDFGYPEKDEPILNDINIDVEAGQVVALVGPSGSGKSTLMALMQRFYDPSAGRICLDGVDLRRIKQKYLRRNIGVVMQDSLLFNESVLANIAYGRPGASLDEVVEAAKAANIHEMVAQLPDGYNTIVGEKGSRFSMGERQRIAIARAILKDPAILILDEATSALDAETEFLVQEALEKLIRNRTTFIVAHRLATVVNADRILILRHGRIAECGNHQELMQQNGYYSSLVHRQTRGLLVA